MRCWLTRVFMHTQCAINNRQRASCFRVFHPSVRCLLTPSLRDAISLHLADGFEWNLAQIFITWVGIAEKVFKVMGSKIKKTFKQKRIHILTIAGRWTDWFLRWWVQKSRSQKRSPAEAYRSTVRRGRPCCLFWKKSHKTSPLLLSPVCIGSAAMLCGVDRHCSWLARRQSLLDWLQSQPGLDVTRRRSVPEGHRPQLERTLQHRRRPDQKVRSSENCFLRRRVYFHYKLHYTVYTGSCHCTTITSQSTHTYTLGFC